MRKFKPCHISIIFLLLAAITSCKTNGIILPMNSSSRLNAISKLPESQKIQQQEMINWYSANIQLGLLQPLWDKSVQTVFNGNHVIQVPLGTGAALVFTKTDGKLLVDAYRWVEQNPGKLPFTGNIMVYSFPKNNVTGSVYNDGRVISTRNVVIPPDVTPDKVFYFVMLANINGLQYR